MLAARMAGQLLNSQRIRQLYGAKVPVNWPKPGLKWAVGEQLRRQLGELLAGNLTARQVHLIGEVVHAAALAGRYAKEYP
jgi:hypothetical protein